MAHEPNTTTDETTTLNGTEITDLQSAKEGLSYLTDDYNGGELHEAEGGRCLIVISRSRQFQHFDLFQRCEHVRIGNVVALNRGDDPAAAYDAGELPETDLRLKVELREAEQ